MLSFCLQTLDNKLDLTFQFLSVLAMFFYSLNFSHLAPETLPLFIAHRPL
jgi:hypothetical protein